VKNFYYHINWGGGVFVKTESFFKSQGGLTEKWGTHWTKFQARSLEHAREVANTIKKEKPETWQIAGVNYR
jgi:hypothetical protein